MINVSSSRSDILWATAVFFISSLVFLLTLNHLGGMESGSREPVASLPLGDSEWAVLSDEDCVGTLKTSVREGELLTVTIEGEIAVQAGQKKLEIALAATGYFNQFGQLFRSQWRIISGDSSIDMETTNINPVKAHFRLAHLTSEVDRSLSFQGPILAKISKPGNGKLGDVPGVLNLYYSFLEGLGKESGSEAPPSALPLSISRDIDVCAQRSAFNVQLVIQSYGAMLQQFSEAASLLSTLEAN